MVLPPLVSASTKRLRQFVIHSDSLMISVLSEATFVEFAQSRFWATCVEFNDPRFPGPNVPGALMVKQAPIQELLQLYRSARSFDEWVASVAGGFESADSRVRSAASRPATRQ
jgi:hypothetical protein